MSSLKQEIETWVLALDAYETHKYEQAISEFMKIGESSKILFNIGIIRATAGNHKVAVQDFTRAVQLDQYLAIAYFQLGVSNFLLGEFEEAKYNFSDALVQLRANAVIDYEQLGLKFRLYRCEILFNRGLCSIQLKQEADGLNDLKQAATEKEIEEHNLMDLAVTKSGKSYTVFSIPVGIVYRPNQSKIKNAKTKDYLGKSRVVAAMNSEDIYTGFSGTKLKEFLSEGSGLSVLDREITKKAHRPQVQPTQTITLPPTPPPERQLRRTQSSRRPDEISRVNTVHANQEWKPSSPVHSYGGLSPILSPTYVPSGRLEAADVEHEPPSMPAFLTTNSHGVQRRPSARSFFPSVLRSRSKSKSKVQKSMIGEPMIEQQSESLTPFSTRDDGGGYGSLVDDYCTERQRPSFRRTQSARTPSARVPMMHFMSHPADSATDVGDSVLTTGSDKPSIHRSMSIQDRFRREYGTRHVAGQEDKLGLSTNQDPSGEKQLRVLQTDISRIKVKVFYKNDVRIMTISPQITMEEFQKKLQTKLGSTMDFRMKIKDDGEEGTMISLVDQEDMDHACEISIIDARNGGKEFGRLEVWCL